MSTSDNSSAWSLALQTISKDAGSFTFQSLPGFIDLFLSDSGISGTNLPFFLFPCIPIVYGSLHFLGWDSQFPSATERILWRIATVGVASSGGAITVILVVFFSNFLKSKAPRFNTALIVIGALLFTIIVVFYMFSSGFLIVESTRQLWYLQPESYVVASWSYYFPHLFGRT